MSEYLIRLSSSTKVMGPYTPEQLRNLADLGQLSEETQYFDEGINTWVSIRNNAALHQKVFPPQKKLALKREVASASGGGGAPVNMSMHTILETAYPEALHGDDIDTAPNRACTVLSLLLMLATLCIIAPFAEDVVMIVKSGVYTEFLFHPYTWIALVDFGLAFALFQGRMPFGLVRFRVMLGMSYFAYTYWALDYRVLFYAAILGYLPMFAISLIPPRMTVTMLTAISALGFAIMLFMGFLL